MERTSRISVLFVPILFFVVALASLMPNDNTAVDVSALVRGIGMPVRIETVQGGNFQGILKSVADDRIEIVADDGQILQIDIGSIEKYSIIDKGVTKRTFFQDSASNRLIVMPTGFPMETGEFHVADQEIIAVTVSYGLNEHASLWAGVSIPGLVLSARYIMTPTDRFALSVGSFAGLVWTVVPPTGAVLPYVVASWGEPNSNFTLGLSPIITFNFGSETPLALSGVVLPLGGKMVLTSTTSLIFENWIIWTKWDVVPRFLFPAVVFRIAGQRLSWDIGAVLPLFINDFDYRLGGLGGSVIFPLPILGVTYRID